MNENAEVEVEMEIDDIEQAFIDGTNDGDFDEDEVKMAMLQAGAKFKTVSRLFGQYMVDHGLALSKEERAKFINGILKDSDLLMEDVFNAAIADVIEGIPNANEKSVGSLIRSWCKANDQEFYKKPQGQVRTGFKSLLYDALVIDPEMSDADLSAFITVHGSSNDLKYLSFYKALRDFSSRIANK